MIENNQDNALDGIMPRGYDSHMSNNNDTTRALLSALTTMFCEAGGEPSDDESSVAAFQEAASAAKLAYASLGEPLPEMWRNAAGESDAD